MKIQLNNSELILSDKEIYLLAILKTQNLYHESGIAIAINNEIVPKGEWENYKIKDNDHILIITATQGG